MPETLEELAIMMAQRDNLSVKEEREVIRIAAEDMQRAFYEGDLDLAEDILHYDLGLEPDYLMLFLN